MSISNAAENAIQPGVKAFGGVGAIRILATNGGPHDAKRWARLTTSMLIETDARSPEPENVEKFRELVAEALEPFFRKADPATAPAAFVEVKKVFESSPWKLALGAHEVAAHFLEVISRRLVTAAADQGAY